LVQLFVESSTKRVVVHALSGNTATVTPSRGCREKERAGNGEVLEDGCPRISWCVMRFINHDEIEEIARRKGLKVVMDRADGVGKGNNDVVVLQC
jgi:hypothetical protein